MRSRVQISAPRPFYAKSFTKACSNPTKNGLIFKPFFVACGRLSILRHAQINKIMTHDFLRFVVSRFLFYQQKHICSIFGAEFFYSQQNTPAPAMFEKCVRVYRLWSSLRRSPRRADHVTPWVFFYLGKKIKRRHFENAGALISRFMVTGI